MAWHDQLQSASFRGVPFVVLAGTVLAGRRMARHEYPQRDIPYMEDMGRRAREYKVEGYIIGADYMSGRDRLLAAIEEEGAGQLVHPYHGTKLVTVGECELTESTEFGGMVKITLPCTEAGEQVEPTIGINSDVQLTDAQDFSFDAVAADFSDTFSIAGLPSWGLADIESTITGFLDLPDFGSIVSDVLAFKSDMTSLLALPASLATRLIGLLRSLVSVPNILARPYVPQAVSGAVIQGGGTQGVVQRQQSAVTVLIKRAALIQQAGILSRADLATSNDVQTARAAILANFDAHDYAVGNPRPSIVVANQLKSVRTAALVHLARQGASLPQTYTWTLVEPLPALVLSYALYGDLRTDEIVRRNAVRHPGFLPAGVPLQLTEK